MNTPAVQGGPAYKVTGVSAGQYQSDGTGNPVRGRLVHYQMSDGTTDQVFIPDAQWGTDSVQQIVESAVERTANVLNLSRGMSS
jgi:hypothetical protein